MQGSGYSSLANESPRVSLLVTHVYAGDEDGFILHEGKRPGTSLVVQWLKICLAM